MKTRISGIIIDDEQNGRDVLKTLIQNYSSDVDIVGEADNIKDAYSLIQLKRPDFILLDIQMPGGNGFDLLKKFEKIDFEIIFVTSFDKYAINAFKFSATDYLLKPVEIDDLVAAIERVKLKRVLSDVGVNEKAIYLLDNVSDDENRKSIALQKGDKVHFIKLAEIIYLEAISNYTRFVLQNSEIFISSKTLKYFEDIFTDKLYFMRISRSIIINIHAVKSYTKVEPFHVYLSNGDVFEISRRRKVTFLGRME
jgi:two-component system LytT family response regulator